MIRTGQKRLADEDRLKFIVEKPEDFMGRVDTVAVVLRHGGLHTQYVLPLIDMGKEIFFKDVE